MYLSPKKETCMYILNRNIYQREGTDMNVVYLWWLPSGRTPDQPEGNNVPIPAPHLPTSVRTKKEETVFTNRDTLDVLLSMCTLYFNSN